MRPADETELSEIVAQAAGPLRIRGGGTRLAVPEDGAEILETGGLAGIRLYEPGALTLVAGTGTPLEEIETALAAEHQRLAFEPPDLRGLLGLAGASTLGGVAATNASGPRRIQTGAARDHMLGIRFVDGAGRVVKNGGRVMKNVTGYDLVKALAGSHGTLGVLSEVAIKVLPRPETEATLVLHGLSEADAVAALSRGLGAPYEVSGAAHLPGEGRTLLRLEGFEDSVRYRCGRLAGLFGDAEHSVLDAAASATAWRAVRDVAPFHDRPGDVWRLSTRPGDAPALAARLEALDLIYDWGGGLVWALLPEGCDARARLGVFAGHATRVRGAGPASAFQPQTPAVAALARGLRARFDPRGVLNPDLLPA
ncbi:FAD-binding protein [Roseivivax sp. CAU 1761]